MKRRDFFASLCGLSLFRGKRAEPTEPPLMLIEIDPDAEPVDHDLTEIPFGPGEIIVLPVGYKITRLESRR